MLPGTNRGALTLGNYLWLQGNYGDGSIESVGIGGSQGNFSFGDNPGEQVGGLVRDDHDAIAINNGAGGIILEKEKAVSFNGILHVIWTDCTDPVKCFRSNFITNYAKVMPGTITSHTDWASGGLANATRTGLGANLIWGSSRWQGEISLEVMYFQLKQDLPCNSAGNAAVAQLFANLQQVPPVLFGPDLGFQRSIGDQRHQQREVRTEPVLGFGGEVAEGLDARIRRTAELGEADFGRFGGGVAVDHDRAAWLDQLDGACQ